MNRGIMKRLITLLALAALCLCTAPAPARSQGPDAWTSDRDMLLFFDAVIKIKKHSVIKRSSGQIVRGALKAYLPRLDPYSQYLTAKEFAEFQQLQSARYSGVGMEIARGPRGRITCLPYPQGPAARAGVQAGDLLLKVGRKKLGGLSLTAVASLIRGKADTPVTLTLRSQGKKPRTVRVLRARLKNRTVTSTSVDQLPLVRIMRFANTTYGDLRRALLALAKAPAVILDLRANPGGDFEAATDCAGLFLPKGRVIVEIKRRSQSKTVRATARPLKLPAKVFIWQDQGTASAAEVFTAALVQNQRAVSLGSRTFGKALRQRIFKLLDGSALIISDAKILTPDGTYYHGHGLKPTYALKGSPPPESAYRAKTKELLAASPPAKPSREVRVRVKTTSAAPLAPQAQVFVACFQAKFKNQRSAEVFSAQVRNSIDNGDHYLIKLKDGRYLVCLGPYPDRSSATAKRQEIETALPDQDLYVLPVSPQVLRSEAKAAGEPAKPTKTTPGGKWAIAAGSFEADSARESALDIMQRIKKAGLACWVGMKGFKSKAQADKAIAFFSKKGLSARWLAPCAQGPSRCLVRYQVYVGPFAKRDKALLGRLVKKKTLPPDAYWIELH